MFHLRDYCTMILKVTMWSVQDLFFLKPICWSRKISSSTSISLCSMIRLRIFPGTDKMVIPLQLLQFAKSPFLGILTRWPSLQSRPGAFPFFCFWITFAISSLLGFAVLTSSTSSASVVATGIGGGGRFNNSSKYLPHLLS